jgi:tryprostatin B 6-hydroxylase
LSINTPDAVQATLGSKSKCTKSPWYEQSLPVVNLHTSRDKKVHERRRKVFSKAFSPAALRDYEVRVVEHAELLTRQLARMEGKPFDATAWFKYFAFDVMGELGFGETFGMLSSEENRWLPDLLERGMSTVGWLSPIPWFTPIFNRLPLLAEGPRRFLEYVGVRVEQRAKSKSEKADVSDPRTPIKMKGKG